MKYFLWILAIVTLVLLFPIPIKITLIYANEIFTLKIYNKVIIPSKTKKTKAKNKNKRSDYVKTHNEEKISKLKFKDLKGVIELFINSKFKFTIRTKFRMDYSIEDAAINAITYGFLYQITAFISTILNLFFKVKNFTPTINIKYNENFFKFESTSIIFINIAKIIYMVIVIFYHLIKVRKTSSFDKVNLKEEF
ncbi:DUF2953 domain-containing protein [Clostridium sulfidigenes]|uniref:DUF2953 domain-containing protein n=1 Tax=Clostridium sulfidigenes TaxID=318464 RepID=UPI000691A058|nr:DUF2953 domain-containing protein [Clostridium sulfidigenes]